MNRTQKLLIAVGSFTVICMLFWVYLLVNRFNSNNDVLRIIRERYGITSCKVLSRETIMRNGPSGELYHLVYNSPNGNAYPFTLEVNRDNGLAQTAYADDTVPLALFSEAMDNYGQDIDLESLIREEDGLWSVKFNSQQDTEELESQLYKLNQVLLQIPQSTNVSAVHIPISSDDKYFSGYTMGTLDWERSKGYSTLVESFNSAKNTYYLGLGCAYGKDAPLTSDVLDSLKLTAVTFKYANNSVTWDLPSGANVLLSRIPELLTELGIQITGDMYKFSWTYDDVELYAGVSMTLGTYYDPLYTTQSWHAYTNEDYEEMEHDGLEPSDEGGYYQINANPLTRQPLWISSTIFPASYIPICFNPEIEMYDSYGNNLHVLKSYIESVKDSDPTFYESTFKDFYERMYTDGDS